MKTIEYSVYDEYTGSLDCTLTLITSDEPEEVHPLFQLNTSFSLATFFEQHIAYTHARAFAGAFLRIKRVRPKRTVRTIEYRDKRTHSLLSCSDPLFVTTSTSDKRAFLATGGAFVVFKKATAREKDSRTRVDFRAVAFLFCRQRII